MLAWEAQGFIAHRNAGLPGGREVVLGAFRWLAEPGRVDPSLPVRVLSILVNRFSWAARAELDSDVLLDGLDSDDGVAAVAEFLWAARHRRTPEQSAQRPEDRP
jgi:hypothetical protein